MIEKGFIICLLGLVLAGCGLEYYPGGDLPTQARLDTIQIGDHREKVLRVLGTPATESLPLADGSSYLIYAQNMKESRAFLEPKEIHRDIHVFVFDTGSKLTDHRHLTLADSRNVTFENGITEVGGRELSVWDQIIQNFGRYNTGAQDSSVRR